MGRRIVGLLMVMGLAGMLMPGPASADTFVTPFVGATFGGDAPSSQPAYGVALGGMAFGIFGVEGEFGYVPNFFNHGTLVTSSHVMTLMANVLVGAPAGPIRPYATVGAGMIPRAARPQRARTAEQRLVERFRAQRRRRRSIHPDEPRRLPG